MSKLIKKGVLGGEYSIAINIDEVNHQHLVSENFGQQIPQRRKVVEFCQGAKKGYVDAKGRSTLAAVKDWVKLHAPDEFYALWRADSSHYKDDSVEIYYR